MKKRIGLTESDLHRVIKESVNEVLNEIGDTNIGQARLGALAARQAFRKGFRYGEFPSDIYKYARDQRIKHGSNGFAFGEGNDSQWWVEAPESFGFNDTDHKKNVEDAKKAAKQRINKAIKESMNKVLKEDSRNYPPIYNPSLVEKNKRCVKYINQIADLVHSLFTETQEGNRRETRFYGVADSLLAVLEKYGLQEGMPSTL